jgi:hypothetical protein
MAENKNIQYINKEFSDFKSMLFDFAKSYFPNTYNDFSPAAPGTMFIEMASAIGDVLAFYQDTQIQENFTQYAREKENQYTLAYMFGYTPKVIAAATSQLDVYQLVPSILSGSDYVPDYNYALIIDGGTQVNVSDNSNVSFYIGDKIDFSVSSSLDPTQVTVYAITGSIPTRFLLKKTVNAISGKIKSSSFNFGSPEKFPKITLEDDNIIKVIRTVDSDGNLWTEVPYLAQETTFEEVQTFTDPNFSVNSDVVPYLLRLTKVPRRFVTRIKSNDTLELQFGAGISTGADEQIIPNPDNVGLGIVDGVSKLNLAFDPSNFLYTNTYGIAPYNTSITVQYLVGGGIDANVPSNTINQLSTINYSFLGSNLNTILQNEVVQSIAINNSKAASGGGDGDTLDDLRLKTLAAFPTQMRAVTLPDYEIRALSLPQKYGSIGKIYVVQDSQLTISDKTDNLIDDNQLSISLYVLGYNNTKQLVAASPALKQNLKTYLSQYKMLTDGVNIKDAYIINIGIQFEIISKPNFNSQQVLLKCINAIKDYFNIDNWQINQPIILNDIYTLLDKIEGVQTVSNVEIINKSGISTGYSRYGYDIKGATRNRIVYPSLDPSIFEIKYPQTDIVGRVVSI